MSEIERWLLMLEAEGGRLTAPRKTIVELLVQTDHALEPLELFDLARKKYPRIGLMTVYRTLELLTDLKLIERVHQADGCHTYLRAAQGHEHILLCTQCGKAQYFTGDDLGSLISGVGRDYGFKVQDHWLQLQGVCSNCQGKS
jgi:Fur family transcriptional regulator, ferric uptake regulator